MDISLADPFAIIADIHGNSDALAAVLADIDADGVTTILNLGDHFSGPLAAAETARMLAARDMISIRGNHDRWLIEQSPETMAASDRAAHDQLDHGSLDWLRRLPSTLELSNGVFLCHGTPRCDTTYWLEKVRPDGQIVLRDLPGIEAAATGIGHSLILCGHTHLSRAVRLTDGRLIVNPGSVGLPAYDDDAPAYHVVQSGSPDARYAIVRRDRDTWQVSFRSIPYDPTRMARIAEDAGRPDWARAVATGWFATGA